MYFTYHVELEMDKVRQTTWSRIMVKNRKGDRSGSRNDFQISIVTDQALFVH